MMTYHHTRFIKVRIGKVLGLSFMPQVGLSNLGNGRPDTFTIDTEKSGWEAKKEKDEPKRQEETKIPTSEECQDEGTWERTI